jgi:predicted SnoaL-like aldol condensation-catalyzing enzyme
VSTPDQERQLLERFRQCVLQKDWQTLGDLLAEDAEALAASIDDYASAPPSGERAAEAPDAEAKMALVRRYFEMWNTGSGIDADAVLSGTYVDHAHPDVVGPAASRSLAPRFHAANPDARLVIEAIVAEGELVTVRNAIHRTREGKEVVSRGIAFFRVAGGKLVEQWSFYPGKRGHARPSNGAFRRESSARR